MIPPEFINALIGGLLIGLAGILLLISDGKIAGISGMIGGLLRSQTRLNGWRYAFLGGLIVGGFGMHLFGFQVFTPLATRSYGALIAAGLLVGLGTQIGSGCTSGHGICGIGRLSGRSLIATVTFVVTGAITVYVVEHILGGAL